MKKDVIVCIGTVGRPTFDKCYRHVMELKKRDPRVKKVVVIRNEPSQAAWLNKMREACKGYTWCLQVDEDMYVKPDCVSKLLKLAKHKEAAGHNILNASGMLYDLFLKQNIGSLKLWRSSAVRKFEFRDVLGSDRDIFKRAKADGYCNVAISDVLGVHDSAPTRSIGSEKYKTYIEKISKFDSLDKSERFIEDMHSKHGDSEIVIAMKRKFVEIVNPKPCIVFHAHYENTFLKCVEYFKRIDIQTDVYLTLSESLREVFYNKGYDKIISLVKNINVIILDISISKDKGVDISYFFESLDYIKKDYTCIVKLHTKSGTAKRHFGLSNDEYMLDILEKFFKKRNFGYMCAKSSGKYYFVKKFMHPYPNGKKENKKNIIFFNQILKEHKLDIKTKQMSFFAGSFVFSDILFLKYLKEKREAWGFPMSYHFSEEKRPDGNIEHAIERYFGLVPNICGLELTEI